jgi:hypothetical protein
MVKRGLLMFGMAMTVAGVASALAVVPGSQAPLPAAAAKPEVALAADAGTPKLTSGPTLAIRQAPVPLVLKRREPVAPPIFDSDAIGPEPPMLKDGLDERAAKAAVEYDGYKAVKVLRRGDNGVWYAQGLRGSTVVTLTVDAQGNVAAQ